MAWCADEDQVAVKRLCSVESGRLVLSLGDSGKGCVEATKVSLAAIGPSRASWRFALRRCNSNTRGLV